MAGSRRRRKATPRARPCPACTVILHPHEVQGVDLDRCTACGGVWFDALELAAAARCALPPVTTVGPSERRCPACSTAMEQRHMGEVHVDGCRTCHGVFLDSGEYRRLRKGRTPVRMRGWSELSKPDDETGVHGWGGAAVLLFSIALDN